MSGQLYRNLELEKLLMTCTTRKTNNHRIITISLL